MADNTVINAGTGGDIIASDDIGGIKWQRVKVTYGVDGVATDVSASSALPVTGQAAATSVVTNTPASTTTVTLKALNTARKALYIYNAGTGTLYLKLGATATTTTSYTIAIDPKGFWELPDDPIYTGVVDGIWAATGGNGALLTELS